jgi:hypothetical protein
MKIENNFNPRILYPAKLSFKVDRTIKVYHDKQKLKQYMTTQKMKANKTVKRQAIPNYRRRKGKKAKSNTDSAKNNQTLNQQRQLHDRDHHVFISTSTEC